MYQPVDIRNMPMFWVSTISMTSTSYVKRLRIRPMGVDSKYDRGAFKTLRSIELNAFSAALVPPVTKGGTPKAYEIAIRTGCHENQSNQKIKGIRTAPLRTNGRGKAEE
jgi:hypothetical protein